MARSIKDHPLYERIRQAAPAEAASWVLGDLPVDEADDAKRKEAFRSVAPKIIAGRTERTKCGFNSDTNSEIARAMEWAFQAGLNAAFWKGLDEAKARRAAATASDEAKPRSLPMRSRTAPSGPAAAGSEGVSSQPEKICKQKQYLLWNRGSP